MLGLHSAITYTNSRTAVANSLGTIFFLMVGILLCAYLIYPQRARIRPAVAELPDLHRRGERRALRLARREEPVASDRVGRRCSRRSGRSTASSA